MIGEGASETGEVASVRRGLKEPEGVSREVDRLNVFDLVRRYFKDGFSRAVVAFMFFPDIAAIVVFVLRMVDASDNVPDTRTRDFVSNDDGLKFRLLFFGTKIVGLDGFFTDADPGAVRVFFVAS